MKKASSKKNRNFSDPWPKTIGRFLGTSLIRLYQLTLSSLIGNHCRHLPTCSEYSYEAIARHGFWPGMWLGFFRFIRCGPGGTSGFDPVLSHMSCYYCWYKPWRYWYAHKECDHKTMEQ